MERDLLYEISRINNLMKGKNLLLEQPGAIAKLVTLIDNTKGTFGQWFDELHNTAKSVADEVGVGSKTYDEVFELLKKKSANLKKFYDDAAGDLNKFADNFTDDVAKKATIVKIFNKLDDAAVETIKRNIITKNESSIQKSYEFFRDSYLKLIKADPEKYKDLTFDGFITNFSKLDVTGKFKDWPEVMESFIKRAKEDNVVKEFFHKKSPNLHTKIADDAPGTTYRSGKVELPDGTVKEVPYQNYFENVKLDDGTRVLIQRTDSGEEVARFTLSVADPSVLTRLFDGDSLNMLINIIRSGFGGRSPEVFMSKVQTDINNLITKYWDDVTNSMKTNTDLKDLNSRVLQLKRNLELAKPKDLDWTATWDNLKKEILNKLGNSTEAMEFIAKIEDANAEKSIKKFIDAMDEISKKPTLLGKGTESAFYSTSNFTEFLGLKTLFDDIGESYTKIAKAKGWEKISQVLKEVLDWFSGFLLYSAPMRFKTLLRKVKNIRSTGMTGNRFIVSLATIYLQMCFMRFVMYPITNAFNGLMSTIGADIGLNDIEDVRGAIERWNTGWSDILQKGEWAKIFNPYSSDAPVPKIATAVGGYVLSKMFSSPEDEIQENEQKLQETIEQMGVDQEDAEELSKIPSEDDRKKAVKDYFGKKKELAQKLTERLPKSPGELRRVGVMRTNLEYEMREANKDTGSKNYDDIKEYLFLTTEDGTGVSVFDKDGGEWTIKQYGQVFKGMSPDGKLYLLPEFGNILYEKAKNGELLGPEDGSKIKTEPTPQVNPVNDSIEIKINKILKEMAEGKRFGDDNFKHWKDTFSFFNYDDENGDYKEVKITSKMDEIMEKINHFRKKYDEDDSFVRAVIDVFGNKIDRVSFTKGLAHLTESVKLTGLMTVLSLLRESKELEIWTVKHYKDGNWEIIKGSFNKKELSNVGKTVEDRNKKKEESERPLDGLKKKEQESIDILKRDEKEGLNGLPTKVKQKLREKLFKGWTTETPIESLKSCYIESEVNSVFNEKIPIYKLESKNEFLKLLNKHSSEIVIRRGFCKTIKQIKNDSKSDVVEHFNKRCEKKYPLI